MHCIKNFTGCNYLFSSEETNYIFFTNSVTIKLTFRTKRQPNGLPKSLRLKDLLKGKEKKISYFKEQFHPINIFSQCCLNFYYFFFLLDFGLSQLTSLQFIQYHVAGFYKPTIPQSPPSHLWDYSTCNNARLEISTIFVPSFDPNEWCLKNSLYSGGLNPEALSHESSALSTRPRQLALKFFTLYFLKIKF